MADILDSVNTYSRHLHASSMQCTQPKDPKQQSTAKKIAFSPSNISTSMQTSPSSGTYSISRETMPSDSSSKTNSTPKQLRGYQNPTVRSEEHNYYGSGQSKHRKMDMGPMLPNFFHPPFPAQLPITPQQVYFNYHRPPQPFHPQQHAARPRPSEFMAPANHMPMQGPLSILMGSSLLPNSTTSNIIGHASLPGQSTYLIRNNLYAGQPQIHPPQPSQILAKFPPITNPLLMKAAPVANPAVQAPAAAAAPTPMPKPPSPTADINVSIESEILGFQTDMSNLNFSSWILNRPNGEANRAENPDGNANQMNKIEFFNHDLLRQLEESASKLEGADISRFQVDVSEQDNNGPFEFLKQFRIDSEVVRTQQDDYYDVIDNMEEYTEKLYYAIQEKTAENLRKNNYNTTTLLQNTLGTGPQTPIMYTYFQQRQTARLIIKTSVQSILEYSENKTVVPRYAREGDWLCQCGNLNFSYRNICNKCNVMKPKYRYDYDDDQSTEQTVDQEHQQSQNNDQSLEHVVTQSRQIILSEFIWVCKCCRSINYCKSSLCISCNMTKFIDRSKLAQITRSSQKKLQKYTQKMKVRREQQKYQRMIHIDQVDLIAKLEEENQQCESSHESTHTEEASIVEENLDENLEEFEQTQEQETCAAEQQRANTEESLTQRERKDNNRVAEEIQKISKQTAVTAPQNNDKAEASQKC